MKKIPVYNPTHDDFSDNYDTNGNGVPITYVVPAREMEYFDEVIANHVKKHLVNRLINEWGSKPNPELARKRYMKEVDVNMWGTNEKSR